jgi:hypothetical protein
VCVWPAAEQAILPKSPNFVPSLLTWLVSAAPIRATRILLTVRSMRVRIVRKLADQVDGIDLSGRHVGDVIELPEPDARVIVAEQWAIPARRSVDGAVAPAPQAGAERNGDGAISLRMDRRRTWSDNDLYEQLRQKQEVIERERRQFQRRAPDDGHPPTSHAA